MAHNGYLSLITDMVHLYLQVELLIAMMKNLMNWLCCIMMNFVMTHQSQMM